MTALYIERYMNWGLTRTELQSGRPIIGIAQTGSDLTPCNRHHLVLAERVREGIREMGGLAFEFPVHPIQETGGGPPLASTATWPTSAWWRCCTATRWTGWC
jgi:dihydroxy-acid dehydratase